MNPLSTEKNIIFFAIILFFTLVVILFYVTMGKKIEERGLVQNASPSPSSIPFQTPWATPAQNNTVKREENNDIHAIVRYEQGLFNPADITVTNETDCVVEIQNTSDQDVIPRLGPYDPKQEKGFLYPAIAPRQTSLIDPRYGIATQFSFYNKNNPSAVFTVSIDPTCL